MPRTAPRREWTIPGLEGVPLTGRVTDEEMRVMQALAADGHRDEALVYWEIMARFDGHDITEALPG